MYQAAEEVKDFNRVVLLHTAQELLNQNSEVYGIGFFAA